MATAMEIPPADSAHQELAYRHSRFWRLVGLYIDREQWKPLQDGSHERFATYAARVAVRAFYGFSSRGPDGGGFQRHTGVKEYVPAEREVSVRHTWQGATGIVAIRAIIDKENLPTEATATAEAAMKSILQRHRRIDNIVGWMMDEERRADYRIVHDASAALQQIWRSEPGQHEPTRKVYEAGVHTNEVLISELGQVNQYMEEGLGYHGPVVAR